MLLFTQQKLSKNNHVIIAESLEETGWLRVPDPN